MRWTGAARNAMILLAFGSATAIPPVTSGFRTLRAAETAAGEHKYQLGAASYRRATYLLPWRADLGE